MKARASRASVAARRWSASRSTCSRSACFCSWDGKCMRDLFRLLRLGRRGRGFLGELGDAAGADQGIVLQSAAFARRQGSRAHQSGGWRLSKRYPFSLRRPGSILAAGSSSIPTYPAKPPTLPQPVEISPTLRHPPAAVTARLLVAGAFAATSLGLAPNAIAQELTGTLKKGKDSRTITNGHLETSVPFSYLDDKQQPVGYSMDICAA